MSTEDTNKSIQETLDNLQKDYLDLGLVQWPTQGLECYRALEKVYEEKKVRAIGVSNFYDDILADLIKEAKVKPAVNQIEMHPLCFRKSLIEQCKKEGIIVTAYRPFGELRQEIMENSELHHLSEKKGKQITQVILRWLVQQDISAIPMTSSTFRIEESMAIDDFELIPEEIEKVNASTIDRKLVHNEQQSLIGFIYNQETVRTKYY